MFESASEAACAPRTRSVRWSMSRAGSMLYTIAHLQRTESLDGGTVYVHTILEPSVRPLAAVAQRRTSCPDQTYVLGPIGAPHRLTYPHRHLDGDRGNRGRLPASIRP